MSTSSKDVLEEIKELQEQVKNLEREVQQLKTEGDKTLSQETVSKVPIVNRSSNYVGVSWHKKNKVLTQRGRGRVHVRQGSRHSRQTRELSPTHGYGAGGEVSILSEECVQGVKRESEIQARRSGMEQGDE